MITQITDLVLLIVLKIVNKLFVQKTSFPFHYPLSLEFFLKILRFYRLHEACYGGFSLIRAIVLIFLFATVYYRVSQVNILSMTSPPLTSLTQLSSEVRLYSI